MIREDCVCGNTLREASEYAFRVVRSPCRCAVPGPSRRTTLEREPSLEHVSRRQYHERKRLGLPLLTPLERDALKKHR
jgi:hypothetical protein